jgi:hypothetical protein
MCSASTNERRWSLALFALAAAALFLLLHNYQGLVHDGRLYTLQALNHLHADLYGNDVFLAFGSQDNFTLFSPLFAWAISGLGLEPAAAVITLSTNLLFLLASYMFARALMTLRQSRAALLLLLLVPTGYGPLNIFHYLEGFVSPRQLAEALTMFSLLAWMQSHRIAGALLATGAMLIHPIIGLSGAALIVTMEWIAPHWRRLWPFALLLGLIAAATLLGMIPVSRWQFDAEWYGIVVNRRYLDLRNWNSDDWGRIVTVFATLAIAGMTLREELRRIAVAALIASSGLLLLAFVGGNLLQIVLVTQAQTWRTLWVATVLAIILLPPVFVNGWPGTHFQRGGLLMLAAAWAAPYASFAPLLAVIALIFAVLASLPQLQRHTRLVLPAAWITLALVVVNSLADALLSLRSDATLEVALPPTLGRLVAVSRDGVLPALVLAAATFAARRFRYQMVLPLMTMSILALVALIAVPSSSTWARVNEYGPAHKAFAAWRQRIPPAAEVFWAGEGSERDASAFYTWVLLERPSYMSRIQASNALFSRASAIEMRDRARTLSAWLPFEDPFQADGHVANEPLLLDQVCHETGIRYVVARNKFADATGMPAPSSVSSPLRNYNLYICP